MITVSRSHDLGLDAARARVRAWVDRNWLAAPDKRINQLQSKWEGNVLFLKGRAGASGYEFEAKITVDPDKVSVGATEPSKVYMGARAGWDDQLKKILSGQLGQHMRITMPLGGLSRDQAKERLTSWMAEASRRPGEASGNARWDGYVGRFFHQFRNADGSPRKSSAYWGQEQVLGIVTVLPDKVLLDVPTGVAEGLDDRARSWEKTLAKQLGQRAGGTAVGAAPRVTPGVFAGVGASPKGNVYSVKAKQGANLAANLRKWVLFNYLWPSGQRVDALVPTWQGPSQLYLTGTFAVPGAGKTSFTATILLKSGQVDVTSSASASNSWKRELARIASDGGQPKGIITVTAKPPAALAGQQATVMAMVQAGLTKDGATKLQTVGSYVSFWAPKKMLAVGGSVAVAANMPAENYGIALVKPDGTVQLSTRPIPSGATMQQSMMDKLMQKFWAGRLAAWLKGAAPASAKLPAASTTKPAAKPGQPVSTASKTRAQVPTAPASAATPAARSSSGASGGVIAAAVAGVTIVGGGIAYALTRRKKRAA